jgi:TonB-linked SusC/RagA family outer membrane protein
MKRKGIILGLGCFLLLGFAFTAYGQQKTVSGTVTDASTGKTLPGVNILVKGTAQGTATNADGKYSLDIPSLQDTLVFTYIGYDKQSVPINGRNTINIKMKSSVISGKQLVVIGYGKAQKKEITGSISSVNGNQLNTDNSTNVGQTLSGKIPGVEVTSGNSPGGTASYRIRGATSITAGNEPLFVIDGMPGAPINALNPQDIESIQVLKGASAAAIYGSRGANGVIIITTKKGQPGKLKVAYNGSVGIQQPEHKLDLLNATQYATFLNSLKKDQGQEPLFSQETINSAGTGTNWQDEVLRDAPVQRHQLTFSGGAKKTNYYISLNYLDQHGIKIQTGIKRYNAHININHTEGKFNFGLHLNTSQVNHQFVPAGQGINSAAGVLGSALEYSPLLPIKNSDGSYKQNNNQDLNNPVAQANTIYKNERDNRTFGNAFIQYHFLEGVFAKVNFGSNRTIARNDNYVSKVTKRGQGTNGQANVGESENSTYLVDVSLHYDRDFKKAHHINAVVDYSYQVFNSRGFNANTQNFPTDAFRYNNLGAGDKEKNVIGSSRSKHQLLSYLGRVKYSYKDRYLLTTSFRVDGSSRFGANNKYGFFPSLALGWRMSDEPFLSNIKPISKLKLRVSYGSNGNQAIGNYNSLVLLGTSGQAVFDNSLYTSIAPIQLADPDLKWEETHQYNAGLDFGFVNNRVTGSMDYFIKKTSNLLLNLPIPATTGFTTSLQNVGDTQNRGFEFNVNTKNVQGGFSWSTSLNFATLKNKVTGLGGLKTIKQGNSPRFLSDFAILKPGEPIDAYYGYIVDGIFQSQEDVDNSAQPDAKPGFLEFKDVSGPDGKPDGKITSADRTIIGNPFPDFTFGFGNDFAFKGFTLHIFFNGKLGQQLLNFNLINTENPIGFRRNRLAYVLNRWTPENHSTRNPSFVQNKSSRAVNSRVVENASFVRLKDLKLSYDFSPRLLQGIKLKSLKIYADVQNLLTITNYIGYDPDVNVNGSANIRIDDNAYPLSRIFTAGIHLSF